MVRGPQNLSAQTSGLPCTEGAREELLSQPLVMEPDICNFRHEGNNLGTNFFQASKLTSLI